MNATQVVVTRVEDHPPNFMVDYFKREWGSEHFQCGRRMGSNLPLLAAVACILLSPVVFYLTARWGRCQFAAVSILMVRFSQEAAGERTVVQRNHITDLIASARRFCLIFSVLHIIFDAFVS